jgi:MerR family transcriptional regulator, thiopeptide resistance regulator
MVDSLPIDEVVRRTGLTSRALRFYEAKGLVAPLRTASGRRLFGESQLERLHHIVVLKSAGLSLSQMKRLFAGHAIDLSAMLTAQLKMLDDEAAQVESARRVIRFALSRIDRGEPVDAETFCSLIESGDKMMNQEPKEWQAVTDRYFSPDEKAKWAEAWDNMGSGFDADAYTAQWKDLGDRIKASMPMDPTSEAAQAFVGEWFELLKPFSAVSTPEMWQGTVKMYDNMDSWAGQGDSLADPGFDKEVWDFMKLATASRLITGGALPVPGFAQEEE